jgi:hypothetical protein
MLHLRQSRSLRTNKPKVYPWLVGRDIRGTDIEGVDGNVHAPHLWKGEPGGLAGVLPWEAPVLVYRSCRCEDQGSGVDRQ